MSEAPTTCLYCDGTDPNCGFREMGKPLDTQADWDATWGRVFPRGEHAIGSEGWLRERFPDKDWHRHPRTDGSTDLCDGTPSDCPSKVRL